MIFDWQHCFRDQLIHHQSCYIAASRHLHFVSQHINAAVPNSRLCAIEQKSIPVDWKHEEDFVTLTPEESYRLAMKLGPWRSRIVEQEASGGKEWNWGAADDLQVGEKYHFEVPDRSAVKWWVEGSKEDVLRGSWLGWLGLGLGAAKSEWIPLEIKESPVFLVTK